MDRRIVTFWFHNRDQLLFVSHGGDDLDNDIDISLGEDAEWGTHCALSPAEHEGMGFRRVVDIDEVADLYAKIGDEPPIVRAHGNTAVAVDWDDEAYIFFEGPDAHLESAPEGHTFTAIGGEVYVAASDGWRLAAPVSLSVGH